MNALHLSFAEPALNLALDELLLNDAEAGRSGEILRFWESPVPFVVLGLTQSVAAHVLVERCEQDGVPILRRCSAGGCVLQGPGCLNFSLVVRQDRPGYETISASYRTILGTLADAFRKSGIDVAHEGISDLALQGRKVSGNAQRRRRTYLLHHGTILYSARIESFADYLRIPQDQPDYRAGRAHPEFTTNLPVNRLKLSSAVSRAFPTNSSISLGLNQLAAVQTLSIEKYETSAWTQKIP